jgi:hypothetical protein
MFHSLDEQIEKTEGGHSSVRARLVRYVEAAILSLVVFGGLYFAIVALE